MAWMSRRRDQFLAKNGMRTSFDSYGYSRLPTVTNRESIDDAESPTRSTKGLLVGRLTSGFVC